MKRPQQSAYKAPPQGQAAEGAGLLDFSVGGIFYGVKKPHALGGFYLLPAASLGGSLDIGSLLAFWALRDFELDLLTFF
jgi:hypothetical protein